MFVQRKVENRLRHTCSRDDDGENKGVEEEIGHDERGTSRSKESKELERRPTERLREARRWKSQAFGGIATMKRRRNTTALGSRHPRRPNSPNGEGFDA